MTNVKHRSHKGLNNRAKNSHLRFRKRERPRRSSRSVGTLQHFVTIFSVVRNLFVLSQANSISSTIRIHRTPGNRRVGSRECTACLKSAVAASPGHVSSKMTTPPPETVKGLPRRHASWMAFTNRNRRSRATVLAYAPHRWADPVLTSEHRSRVIANFWTNCICQ